MNFSPKFNKVKAIFQFKQHYTIASKKYDNTYKLTATKEFIL